MAEQIAAEWAKRTDLDVDFDSAGTSDEEHGNPIDPRSAKVLRAHGYPEGRHRAQQITHQDIEDSLLVLGFEPMHLSELRTIAPEATNLALITDFDPHAPAGSGIDDPWYHGAAEFEATFQAIEASMPGIFKKLRELIG